MTNYNNDNIITLKYSDFDPKNLEFTLLQDSKNNKSLKIAYPKYSNNKTTYIQGPYFQLNDIGSGIPKLTEKSKEYFPTEKSREYLKVPLDQDNLEHKLFTESLRVIDAFYNSSEFRKQNFGTKANIYEYVPLIKDIPEEVEEDPENPKDPNKKMRKHPLIKFKFETDNDTKIITTTIFKVENKVRKEVDNINNINDLEEYIKYNSKIRVIFRFVKLWANAPNKKSPMYGITIKATKIEVESNGYNKNDEKSYKKKDTFIDSDNEDEDEDENVNDNKQIKDSILNDNDDDDDDDNVNNEDIKNTKINKNNESDENKISDDENKISDDEDDIKIVKKSNKKLDENEIKPVKKPIKKLVKQNDSDEDEIKPVKKPIKKLVKQSESDDEDIKPVKKPIKKLVKQSESDDEEIKSVKKTIKKINLNNDDDDDDDNSD